VTLRLVRRLGRLEARAPKPRQRVILVWVDKNGRTTKAADSDPSLTDTHLYDKYCFPYGPGNAHKQSARVEALR